MPTAGKTKMGKLLAKILGYNFVDIDDCIVAEYHAKKLSDVVAMLGEKFKAAEERITIRVIQNLTEPTIIATGGSVIYEQEAMQCLHRNTYIIHLNASFKTVERRLERRRAKRLDDGGIVSKPGQTLAQLYVERNPHYHIWAHCHVKTNRHRSRTALWLAEYLAKNVIGKVFV